jgi:hypothetical protein
VSRKARITYNLKWREYGSGPISMQNKILADTIFYESMSLKNLK